MPWSHVKYNYFKIIIFIFIHHKHGRQYNATDTDSKKANRLYTKISRNNSLYFTGLLQLMNIFQHVHCH